jgi:deoxyadenosine/deoxycytidine kinase
VYIVIEGPIGVGKTSLSRILASETGAQLNLEVVEENPFLASFYEEPERYSFNVQVFFLLSRFKQLSKLVQDSLFERSVISDYMFDKDFIFASMNLREAEFDLYQDLYDHLKPRLAQPDLTVYLRSDPDLLLGRIAKRGRTFEKAMDPEYLRTLGRHYDEYFRTYAAGPLLVLEANQFDFVGNLEDRNRVVNQILERAERGTGLTVAPEPIVEMRPLF